MGLVMVLVLVAWAEVAVVVVMPIGKTKQHLSWAFVGTTKDFVSKSKSFYFV